jgi:hypothetical protein
MKLRFLRAEAAVVLAGLWLGGCVTAKPYDYTNFRQHRPRSILVLPPVNQSTDIRGTYGYLSTVTEPLAEMGYYVFPVAIVDQFLKDNGLPGPGEMQQAPLRKLGEIFGADSVLYITLLEYGTKYHLLNSAAVAHAKARLVDTKTGTQIWEGETRAEQVSNSGGGGLIGALVSAAVSQAISSSQDSAHMVSRDANTLLFTGSALPTSEAHANTVGGPPLLYGPYHPKDPTVN